MTQTDKTAEAVELTPREKLVRIMKKEITRSGHCNHCPRQNCDDPG